MPKCPQILGIAADARGLKKVRVGFSPTRRQARTPAARNRAPWHLYLCWRAPRRAEHPSACAIRTNGCAIRMNGCAIRMNACAARLQALRQSESTALSFTRQPPSHPGEIASRAIVQWLLGEKVSCLSFNWRVKALGYMAGSILQHCKVC